MLLVAVLAAIAGARAAPAQAPAHGGMAGSVIDATTERPLANAVVAVWHAGAPAETPLLQLATDVTGAYHLRGLPVGAYRVRVRAIGYRPAELQIHLGEDATYQVSVGLQLRPVRLQPVRVSVPSEGAYGRGALDAADAQLRLAAQSSRRERYASPESHVITAADVRDAVTLAEADVFRALQRLPGVSARDEYSAALWTRGAPWTHTAVTFDGLPLFNGLHAAGLVAAVNPDALGGVVLHTGVQPGAAAGGAAGLLELTSRRGITAGRGRAMAELSVLSGRAAYDVASGDGATALAVAARRSHFDVAPSALRLFGGATSGAIPYGFSDLVVRADRQLGNQWALEASGLVSHDALRGEIPGFVEHTRARWGATLVRVTLARELWHGELRQSVGYSALATHAESRDSSAIGALLPGFELAECGCVHADDAYVAQPTDNGISHAMASLSWTRDEPSFTGSDVGVSVSRVGARYSTAGAWPHGGRPGDVSSWRGDHTVVGAWAEHGLQRGRFALRPALRAELGPSARGSALRLAPRISGRVDVARDVTLSAGVSRTWQYAQTIAPPGAGPNAIATADLFWIVADATVAPMRSDFASLGAEWRVGSVSSAAVSVYGRRTSGVAVPDPAPGSLAGRPLFVIGSNQATGVELSARRMLGRWMPSASYAFATSSVDAGGTRYASPFERRHVVRVGSTADGGGGLRASTHFTYASGAPFTRYHLGTPVCRDGSGCSWGAPPSRGEPSAGRAASVRALDVAVEWTRRARAVRYTLFAQGLNLLQPGREVTYLDSRGWCRGGPSASCDPSRGQWDTVTDNSLAGLPRAFAAGARVVY